MAEQEWLITGPADATTTVVLAHGAGAAMDSDFLGAVARGLGERDLRVVRFEFPYMAARRQDGKKRPPNREAVLLDCWRDVVGQLRETAPRLVIGGKSMGGRMASVVADEVQAQGLLCLGYPFHPPGKPERLRIQHLQRLRTPTLILQGERDPFGRREEVAGYALGPNVRCAWLPDGDHSFSPRKRSGYSVEGNLALAVREAAAFIDSL